MGHDGRRSQPPDQRGAGHRTRDHQRRDASPIRTGDNATNALICNGGTVFSNNGWGANWSGPVTLNASRPQWTRPGTMTFNGNISGAGGFTTNGRQNRARSPAPTATPAPTSHRRHADLHQDRGPRHRPARHHHRCQSTSTTPAPASSRHSLTWRLATGPRHLWLHLPRPPPTRTTPTSPAPARSPSCPPPPPRSHLTSGSTPADPGTPLTFTATVTGSTPTGNVAFYDGTTLLGTSALNGSFQASFHHQQPGHRITRHHRPIRRQRRPMRPALPPPLAVVITSSAAPRSPRTCSPLPATTGRSDLDALGGCRPATM